MATNIIQEWYIHCLQTIQDKYMTGVILYLALPQVFLYCLLATLVCFSQEKKSDLFVWPCTTFSCCYYLQSFMSCEDNFPIYYSKMKKM